MSEIVKVGATLSTDNALEVPETAYTQPNRAYCIVKDYGMSGLTFNNLGDWKPKTFKEFLEPKNDLTEIQANIDKTDSAGKIKVLGVEYSCTSYIYDETFSSVTVRGFKYKVFMLDLGEIEPLTVLAVCIGIGILIGAIAVSTKIFEFSTEETQELLNNMLGAVQNTMLGVTLILAIFLFAGIFLIGGNASYRGVKIQGKGRL